MHASHLTTTVKTFIVDKDAWLAFMRGRHQEMRSAFKRGRGGSRKPRARIVHADFVKIRLGYAGKKYGCAALFEFRGQSLLRARSTCGGNSFVPGDHVITLGRCVEWANIYAFPGSPVGASVGATHEDVAAFARRCIAAR